jgi:hypothetical protein
MPSKRPYGKRVITTPIKLSAEERRTYLEIAESDETDRTLSYVMRELALRGLVEYRKDGKLRASPEEISAALSSDSKSAGKKFGNR